MDWLKGFDQAMYERYGIALLSYVKGNPPFGMTFPDKWYKWVRDRMIRGEQYYNTQLETVTFMEEAFTEVFKLYSYPDGWGDYYSHYYTRLATLQFSTFIRERILRYIFQDICSTPLVLDKRIVNERVITTANLMCKEDNYKEMYVLADMLEECDCFTYAEHFRSKIHVHTHVCPWIREICK